MPETNGENVPESNGETKRLGDPIGPLDPLDPLDHRDPIGPLDPLEPGNLSSYLLEQCRRRLFFLKVRSHLLISALFRCSAVYPAQALALTMSTQPDMPLNFAIGAKKAFERNYAFPYTRRTIKDETIYVCNKGSEYARADEFLVLRYDAGI